MSIQHRPARAGLPVLAALATAWTMAAAAPALAEGTHVQRPAIVGTSVMRWLYPVQKAAPILTKRERQVLARGLDSRHGRGTYVCTASGFGSRPSCFAR